VLGFILAEAARDLRRIGGIGVSAVLLIALSIAVLGGFWLLSLNLERAVSQWRARVRVIVYLKDEPAASKLDDLLRQVQAIPGVQEVRYVSKDQALRTLRHALGAQAEVTEHLPRNPLPASLEVTPDAQAATPLGSRALVQRLTELPGVDEVQAATRWLEGLAHFRRLFELIGLGVGAVLALAAILTVTTATTLVLHQRRDEMEIMRLVGARESVIRLPRMLQGTAQGLVAAAIAVAILVVAYAFVAPRLQPLLPLTLGLDRLTFLSGPQMLLLMAGGAVLGGMGGMLASRRVRP
jgi:cell division transport system permease protein